MALSVVQTKTAAFVDNVASTTLTFDSTPAAGNLIVVCAEGWSNSGFDAPAGTVTDNKGNTYTQAVLSALDVTQTKRRATIFYAYNISSSATFTVTLDPPNADNYITWSIEEIAGATTTDPLDKTASNAQASATAILSGTTATLSQAAEIVYAVCALGAPSTIAVESVSPSWNEIVEQLDGSNHQPGEIDRRIVAATTAQSCSWTAGAATTAAACIATFKEAGAGGGALLYPAALDGMGSRFRALR